jgi:hypothetical protein
MYMDAGGLVGVNFTNTGGSALTNIRRPSEAVTEVIWAEALLLKPNNPVTAAEITSVARIILSRCLRDARLGEGIVWWPVIDLAGWTYRLRNTEYRVPCHLPRTGTKRIWRWALL